MENIDTLIKARWIIPVADGPHHINHQAVAVHNGRILEILPVDAATTHYQAKAVIELPNHALIPGLINAHTHAAMSLFRGMADDMPLNDWLQNKVWPAEARWVNEQFVHDGTALAAAEMIRSGTTCFADMYYYPDIAAKAAKQAGIRACVGLIVLDFPTIWAADANEYLSKGLSLRDELANDALISTIFAPHAPYTVSDEPLKKIRMYADELDLQIMCHVHETADEVAQAVNNHGKRPLQRLNELGLVSPALNAVHMTQLSDEEIQLVADSGAHVIHCPESNLKLASGYCPVHALLQAGANVALGTDGAASNNDLNMIGEMRSAALLAKSVANNAGAVPAYEVLKMATINAAKALGLADNLGSLQAGKAADIVAIDLNALKTQPVYDPVSQIVYSADSTQVSDVWIAGKRVLHNGVLTTLNTDDLIQRAQQWRDKIIQPE
ncbi:MAG: TRZ/ATZ family hydrolase [Gammaproteobacteria bacterium]|nr:TRZ/ATZ family hydrolase [Gammaproteobacteria bacterium]